VVKLGKRVKRSIYSSIAKVNHASTLHSLSILTFHTHKSVGIHYYGNSGNIHKHIPTSDYVKNT